MPRERGFSLIEMGVVMAILMIMGAFTLLSLRPAMIAAHADDAAQITLMQLRNARQSAVYNRKMYIVTFSAANTTPATIITQRLDIVGGVPVNISTVAMPLEFQFTAIAGVPNTAGTTPDGFGIGNRAVDFSQGINLGVLNVLWFMPDGTAQDANGNINSGVVYTAQPGNLYSSRAVTVFGASGRSRTYRLIANKVGNATWVPQ
jgi:type II secretory pathway pseudopilin PulG